MIASPGIESTDVWVLDATNRVHVIWHTCHDAAATITRLRAEVDWLRSVRGLGRIGLAFDDATSFRATVDPTYKQTRKEKDPSLSRALDEAPDNLADLGEVLCADGYEADDVMATVAAAAFRAEARCVLVSPDKDLIGCLVPGAVTICRRYQRQTPWDWLRASDVPIKFGIPVERWVEYQMLVGDSTDNIRGWDGVGDKTAAAWLAQYPLEDLLRNEWTVKMNERQRRGRADFVKRHETIRDLVTLRRDVPHVTDWI